MDFQGIPVQVSEHAVTTRVEFILVGSYRRRKRWHVRRKEHREPTAYIVNSGALSLTCQLGREVLVIHPKFYKQMCKA
jgi:hypothetical protein